MRDHKPRAIFTDSMLPLLQAFKDELESSKPVISDGLAYGRQILEDDAINDDNKAAVRQDIRQLEDELSRLEQANADEERRWEVTFDLR